MTAAGRDIEKGEKRGTFIYLILCMNCLMTKVLLTQVRKSHGRGFGGITGLGSDLADGQGREWSKHCPSQSEC